MVCSLGEEGRNTTIWYTFKWQNKTSNKQRAHTVLYFVLKLIAQFSACLHFVLSATFIHILMAMAFVDLCAADWAREARQREQQTTRSTWYAFSSVNYYFFSLLFFVFVIRKTWNVTQTKLYVRALARKVHCTHRKLLFCTENMVAVAFCFCFWWVSFSSSTDFYFLLSFIPPIRTLARSHSVHLAFVSPCRVTTVRLDSILFSFLAADNIHTAIWFKQKNKTDAHATDTYYYDYESCEV